jgi:hypothetical protein
LAIYFAVVSIKSAGTIVYVITNIESSLQVVE